MTKWIGVVTLNCPLIDKICAQALIERAEGGASLPITKLWAHPVCPDDQIEAWRDGGIFPIDLGREKYRLADVGSATEFVARYLKLDGAPVADLVKIANKNNSDGFLKSQKFLAPAWLIRKMYSAGYDQREVVERTSAVVKCWLSAWGSNPQVDAASEVAALQAEFGSLLETVNLQFSPLTFSRYLRDMWRLGVSPAAIRQNLGWWLDASDAIVAREEAARDLVGSMEKYEFPCNGWRGVVIETEDDLVSTAVAEKCDVLITRNPKRGHVAVISRPADLKPLAAALQREEQNIWHAAEHAVVNGGLVYVDQEATKLSRNQVIRLVQAHVRPQERYRRGR